MEEPNSHKDTKSMDPGSWSDPMGTNTQKAYNDKTNYKKKNIIFNNS